MSAIAIQNFNPSLLLGIVLNLYLIAMEKCLFLLHSWQHWSLCELLDLLDLSWVLKLYTVDFQKVSWIFYNWLNRTLELHWGPVKAIVFDFVLLILPMGDEGAEQVADEACAGGD